MYLYEYSICICTSLVHVLYRHGTCCACMYINVQCCTVEYLTVTSQFPLAEATQMRYFGMGNFDTSYFLLPLIWDRSMLLMLLTLLTLLTPFMLLRLLMLPRRGLEPSHRPIRMEEQPIISLLPLFVFPTSGHLSVFSSVPKANIERSIIRWLKISHCGLIECYSMR